MNVSATLQRDNRRLLGKLCVFVIAMFGFGYALVPFYERICEATGLRNIARADVVTNTQIDTTRDVRIEFDSNIRKLPWQFRALTPVVAVHPGEVRQVVFEMLISLFERAYLLADGRLSNKITFSGKRETFEIDEVAKYF